MSEKEVARYLMAGLYVKTDDGQILVSKEYKPGFRCLADYPPTEIRSIKHLAETTVEGISSGCLYDEGETFDPANALEIMTMEEFLNTKTEL